MSILTVSEDCPAVSAMERLRSLTQHSEQKLHASADLSEEETRHETNPCTEERDNSRDIRTTCEETEEEHAARKEEALSAASSGQRLDLSEGYTHARVSPGYLAACSGGADTPGQVPYDGTRFSSADQLRIPKGQQHMHEEEHCVEYTLELVEQSEPGLHAARLRADKVYAGRWDQATGVDMCDLSSDSNTVADAFYPSCNRFSSEHAFPAEQAQLLPGNRELPANLATAARQREAEQVWQRQQQQTEQPQQEGAATTEGVMHRPTADKEEALLPRQRLSPVLLAHLEQSQVCDTRVTSASAGAYCDSLTAVGGGSATAAASVPDNYAQWLARSSDMGISAGGEERLAEDDEISFDLSSTDDWTEDSGGCFFQDGTSSNETAAEHLHPQTEEAEETSGTTDHISRGVSTTTSSNGKSSATRTATTGRPQASARATGGGFPVAIEDSHSAKALQQQETEMCLEGQKHSTAVETVATEYNDSEKDEVGEVKPRRRNEDKTGITASLGKQGNRQGSGMASKQEFAGRANTQKRKSKRQSGVGDQKPQQRQQHVLPMQQVRIQRQDLRESHHPHHYRKRESSHEKRQQQQLTHSQTVLRQTQQGQLQMKHQRQRREQRVEGPSSQGDCLPPATVTTVAAAESAEKITHDREFYFQASEGCAPASPNSTCPSVSLLPSSTPVRRGRSPPPNHDPCAAHALKQQQLMSQKPHRVSSCGSSKSNSSHSSTRSPPARLQATQILKAISRMACEHSGKKGFGRGPCWNDLPPAAQRKILEALQQQRSLITCRAHIRKAVEAMQRAASTTSGVPNKGKTAAGTAAAAAIPGSATAGAASYISAEAHRRGLYEQRPHGKREGMRQQSTREQKAKSSALRKGPQAAAGESRGPRGPAYTSGRCSTDATKNSSNSCGSSENKRGRKTGSALAATAAASRSSSSAALGGIGASSSLRSSAAAYPCSAAAARGSPAAATGSTVSSHIRGGSAAACGSAACIGSAAAATGELTRGRKGNEKREKQRSSSWNRFPRRLGMSFSAHSLHSSSCNRLLCPHGLRYKSLCAHCSATGLLQQQAEGGSSTNNEPGAALPLHNKLWGRKSRSDSRNTKHVALWGADSVSSSSSTKRYASVGSAGAGEKAENLVFERLWSHAVSRQRTHSAASLRHRNSSTQASRVAAASAGDAADAGIAAASRVGKAAAASSAEPAAAFLSETKDASSSSSNLPHDTAARGLCTAQETSLFGNNAASVGLSPGAARTSAGAFAPSSTKTAVNLSLSVNAEEGRGTAEKRDAGRSASVSLGRSRKGAAAARIKSGKVSACTASTKNLLNTLVTKEKAGGLKSASKCTAGLSGLSANTAALATAKESSISSSCNDAAAAQERNGLPDALNGSRGPYQLQGQTTTKDDREREEKERGYIGAAAVHVRETVSQPLPASSASDSEVLPLFDCPVRRVDPGSSLWQQDDHQWLIRKSAEEQQGKGEQQWAVQEEAAVEGGSKEEQQQLYLRVSSPTQQQLQQQQMSRQTYERLQQQEGAYRGNSSWQAPSLRAAAPELHWQQQWKRQQEMWLTAAYLHRKEQQQREPKRQQPPLLVYNYAVPSPWQPSDTETAAATRDVAFLQGKQLSSQAASFAAVAPAGSSPTVVPSEALHDPSVYQTLAAAAPLASPPQKNTSTANLDGLATSLSSAKDVKLPSPSPSQPAELRLAGIGEQRKGAPHIEEQKQQQGQPHTQVRRSTSLMPHREVSTCNRVGSPSLETRTDVCYNRQSNDCRQPAQTLPQHAGCHQKKATGGTAASRTPLQPPSRQHARSVAQLKPLQEQEHEQYHCQQHMQQQQACEWEQCRSPERRLSRAMGLQASVFSRATHSSSAAAADRLHAAARVQEEQLKGPGGRTVVEGQVEVKPVERQNRWSEVHTLQHQKGTLNVAEGIACKTRESGTTQAEAGASKQDACGIREEGQSLRVWQREEETRSNVPINLSNWCVQDLRIETRLMSHAMGKKLSSVASQRRKTQAAEKRNSSHGLRESPSTAGVGLRRPSGTLQKEQQQYHCKWQGNSTAARRQQHQHLQPRQEQEKRETCNTASAIGEQIIGQPESTEKKQHLWRQAWQQQQLRWSELQPQQHASMLQQQQHMQKQHEQQNQKQQLRQQQLSVQPQQEGETLKEEGQKQQLWRCASLPQQKHVASEQGRNQWEREHHQGGHPDALPGTPVAGKAHLSSAAHFLSTKSTDYGNRKKGGMAYVAAHETGMRFSNYNSGNGTTTSFRGPVISQGWPEAAAALADCLAEEAAQGCSDAATHLIACGGSPIHTTYALLGGCTAPPKATTAGGTPACMAMFQHQMHAGATNPEIAAGAPEEIAIRSGFLRRRRSRSRQSEGSTRSPSCHAEGEKEDGTKKKKGLAGWLPFF